MKVVLLELSQKLARLRAGCQPQQGQRLRLSDTPSPTLWPKPDKQSKHFWKFCPTVLVFLCLPSATTEVHFHAVH